MWDKILAVNVKGYAFCAKYVVPHMKTRGSGSIVNIASISSLHQHHSHQNGATLIQVS
jgi:NAD(P)-dependent dehydrogenase (short-subunit alcohol dehydrogenase family)